MSKFAYILSASYSYTPELCACLNSLEFINNKEDVYILHCGDLPEDLTSQFNKLSYKIILHEEDKEEVEKYGMHAITLRKRYYYVSEWGVNYEAIAVIDADMFFVRPVDMWFDIASKTDYVFGATLEQKRQYGVNDLYHSSYSEVDGWYGKDICAVPFFADARKYKDFFKENWTIFTEKGFRGNDMDCLNFMILAKGLKDKLILLPNYSWVGTNEKLLKPYTRAVELDDKLLWTESGEPIFIVHGMYYKHWWRHQQIMNRKNCNNGYLGGSPRSDGVAQAALDTLYNFFKKMLDYRMEVPKIAYSGNGEPEDSKLVEEKTDW